ncbi:hypothetical protein QLQ12_46240 [Actinoplanes sp. NEAU-A12]|uniref:Secreted protein n=1 Tax=Actinoplanes sandaracinus TaxID=3045177 RepID=A0ABT6X2E0_9ACTN|nr:hypothetical protein [Actinoplanes sandaracinus]MDI6105995.1 hypothetical protein [Actinoplanes sandaracinus]
MNSTVSRRVIPVAFGALAGVSIVGAVAAPANAADIQSPGVVAAAACGEFIVPARPGSTVKLVKYTHCGSGSVRVKAIIDRGPDSDCVTVGSNETKSLVTYIPTVQRFNRIVRC